MAPGGSSSERTVESRPRDPGISPKPVEFKTSHHRKITTLNNVKCDINVASKTAVHELLECPVCADFMYPPIRQCPNGHTLCSKCQLKIRSCPICRDSVGNIRCLALERVAESLELPCAFQISGCQDVLPFQSKLKHEQNCKFRPYNCPCPGDKCTITGDIQFLVAHLESHHKVNILDGPTLNRTYTNPQYLKNATWFSVINCYDNQFCLHFEAFNQGTTPVFMAFILFMGENSDAGKFTYSLEVGGNGRKMTWEGIPRSIRDSHLKVRDSNDGLIIQRNMALFFSGGDGKELNLTVTCRIWKKQA